MANSQPKAYRQGLSATRDVAGTPAVMPEPGELCSCGRPALEVYLTELHGRVGWCGLYNVDPLEPCTDPACPKAVTRHDRRWCAARLEAESQ